MDLLVANNRCFEGIENLVEPLDKRLTPATTPGFISKAYRMKILDIEVSADPGQRRKGQGLCGRQVLVKQMAGAPVKGKCVRRHRLVFERYFIR